VTEPQHLTRRDAIARYRLLESPDQSDLQGLVELAAVLCGVPTAVINIIDDRFQYQVAAVGIEPSVCSYDDSMCAVALRNPGLVVVQDASKDERFATNPFVTGVIADVRFYASSPLITPAGVAIGTICIFDDVVRDLTPTLSNSLELIAQQIVEVLELRRTSRELENSNQKLERFAAQVSHDLRNPLTAISGFIELAADSPEVIAAPSVASSLARAESAANRMDTMIGDLLDFARLGGNRPRQHPVDLLAVLHEVTDDLDQALAATELTIEVDAGVQVTGDETLMRTLFQNLIANAVKFAAASGVKPSVDVRAVALDGSWRITIDDNGPGVPTDQRERVFGFMERAADDNTPGLGIGLSTCRRIVELFGGTIGIDESPLGGTSVWMIFPRSI
jgi:signal transduction histidine kinase